MELQSRTEDAEIDEKTKAIVRLLEALQRRANAEVEIETEEGAFTMTLKEWKMEDAEVDKWDKVLVADAYIDH